MKQISELEEPKLTFLDISYCKLVTDEGLNTFASKPFQFTHLFFRGLSSATSAGFLPPIMTSTGSLQIFEACLNDQEEMAKGEFAKALAFCFELEVLDLGSCKALTDEFFNVLTSGERIE